MLILILSGLLASIMLSSNIYAQKDLNFQYRSYPKNLVEAVKKASEDSSSLEIKLLECVTYSNSASLKESREMYKQTWSEIQRIIESEVSVDAKTDIITFKWNALDPSNSPIPSAMDMCAKSYDETGKFLQELDEMAQISKS
jgi:hypothetical protein